MEKLPTTYQYTRNGFRILNGARYFNRPLYGTHNRDRISSERFLVVAGDRPRMLLLLTDHEKIPACMQAKCGTLFLGIAGSKSGACESDYWCSAFGHIAALYNPGWMRYELNDANLRGATLILEVISLPETEGIIVKFAFQTMFQPLRLVIAFGGLTDYPDCTHYQGDIQQRRRRDFAPHNCQGNSIEVSEDQFRIQALHRNLQTVMVGATTFHGVWSIKDANAIDNGPDSLLGSSESDSPVAVFNSLIKPENPAGYLAILRKTPESRNPTEIFSRTKLFFEKSKLYHQDVRRSIEVKTPIPQLNMGVESLCLAMDACWHDPTFYHGPWSWHAPYLGWRNWYGPTVLGWHKRVETAIKAHADSQIKAPRKAALHYMHNGAFAADAKTKGAMPSILGQPWIFYNMGEIFVDHTLHHLDWTGDTNFAKKIYQVLRNFLSWEKKWLERESGLYENYLNTWISDAHSYNGGGCIQSSAYNFKAHDRMAKIAQLSRRGSAYHSRQATKIRTACLEKLWVPEKGIFAEYLDSIGNCLRHESPELASIYTPIDSGLVDDFQAYQMLRFTETELRNEYHSPFGGRLVWSSNWLPVRYSSCGLYPQENAHLLWCYYCLGLEEKADELLRGLMSSLYQGPSPGAFGHEITPSGEHCGSVDFSDTTSIFLRTIVEGLFGVRPRLMDNIIAIHPCFPSSWDRAALKTPDLSMDYHYSDFKEEIRINTVLPCRKNFRIACRLDKIARVKVNGVPVKFSLVPGINSTYVLANTGNNRRAALTIEYEDTPRHHLQKNFSVVRTGTKYGIRVKNGEAVKIHDPQRTLDEIIIDKNTVNFTIAGKQKGWHTFFVLTRNGEMRRWNPVDICVQETPTARELSLGSGVSSLPLSSSFQTVSLEDYCNDEVRNIHQPKYLAPRPRTYSIMTQLNGRSPWDWTSRGYRVVKIEDSHLRNSTGKNDVYLSSIGVPFQIARSKTSVRTANVSLWDNLPTLLTVPVKTMGSTLYVFLIGVTNPMQSRVVNGRITICYDNTMEECFSLVNPDELDDWLSDPSHLKGITEYLGEKTHGIILDFPLKSDLMTKEIRFEAMANEVVIGILGLTISR